MYKFLQPRCRQPLYVSRPLSASDAEILIVDFYSARSWNISHKSIITDKEVVQRWKRSNVSDFISEFLLSSTAKELIRSFA